MRKEFTKYMINSISNWNNIYQNGILVYDWPIASNKFHDFVFDFEVPEDIRISLLSLFGESINETLHSKKLTDFLGDSSIYELLTGTTKYDYTLEEGRDLVKWYLLSYWSFKYR
ncbi:MAG: hypothetical protein K8R85_10665 [Bacteroidetes bacterium]|nr:hypothetical protein [Bacteroidota bacterium]